MEFGKIVKKGIEKQKMLAWQYNAVGVSDAITMGGEGSEFEPPTSISGLLSLTKWWRNAILAPIS